MDREIKFRGKRIDNGEWVYGNYIHILGNDFKEHHITSFKAWGDNCKIDPVTVGQFTGLRDKYGVEIYESDVVRTIALSNDHHQKGATAMLIVKYFMGNACLCESKYETGVPIYPFCVDHLLEVIGNIYENPELLEVTNNG